MALVKDSSIQEVNYLLALVLFSLAVLKAIYMYTSTGFIGYAPEIYELMWDHEIQDVDDDQLYYTNLYLNQTIRVCT